MKNVKEQTGRTVNTKRNILFGLLQVIVSQLLPFIVRTILIKRFGIDYLGLNSLFSSVLSVLSLMELGFGTAVVYSMYKPVAENDKDLICAYLSYYRKIYRYIGLAILAVGLAIMPFLKDLIKEQTIPGGLNIHICYLIFLGDTVISYLLYGYMTAIPTAYQRKDILSKVDIGICFLQSLVKIIILFVSKNYYLYLISIPAITVVRNLLNAWIIRKKYPELVCKGNLQEDQKRELNRKVQGLLIGKLTAVSRNSIDTLCISAFVGLAVTGIYNNYYFVMTSITAFSLSVLSSMLASVGNSIAVESREKNYSDMRLFDFVYMAIAGWATVCLLCLYQPFIRTWLGDDMMLEIHVVLGLCAYFYILKSGDIRWVYQEGAGQWYECRYIMIGEAAANVVLNILLCKALGVFGIVLATVISVLVSNAFFFPRVLFRIYFQNGKDWEHLSDHGEYTVTLLLTAVISWFFCEKILPTTMIEGIGSGAICITGRLIVCTVFSVMVFWLIWHRSERYKKAVLWIKHMRRNEPAIDEPEDCSCS